MSSTEVQVAGSTENAIQNYSSMQGSNHEDRVIAFNALSNAESIGDNLGKTINLRHIIVQSVDMQNDMGETLAQPRVTLIDDEGNAFFATSNGVYDGVKMLINIFGEPSTWEAPIPVYVDKVKTNKGRNVFVVRVEQAV